MINIPFRLLSSILLLTSPVSFKATAQNINDSVILLSNPSGECATGFAISEHEILTNGHVVRSLCPQGICGEIKLSKSLGIGTTPTSQIETKKITIQSVFASRDITVLHYEGTQPLIPLVIAENAPAINSNLSIVGFPACERLEAISGTLHTTNLLEIKTTAKGTFGNSGSPILNDEGKVIAITTASSDLSEGISGLIFGGRFQLKGSLITDLPPLFSLTPSARLIEEARTLNSWYEDTVLPLRGIVRIEHALDFLLRVEEMGASSMGVKDLAPLPRTSLYLDSLSPTKEWNSNLAVLAFYAAHAEHGILNERFSPATLELPIVDMTEKDSVFQALNIAQQKLSPYISELPLGVTLQLILYSVIGALLFTLIAAIWGFSVGAICHKLKGGFLIKCIKISAIGLLWPFSLIIFALPQFKKKGL